MARLYLLLRSLFFLLTPERAHCLSMWCLRLCPRFLIQALSDNEKHLMGLTFSNPIGIAAGLEINGDDIDALAKLGVGFIEIGGVTPMPQEGNPFPRVFRLTAENAIINRKGFANLGVDHLVRNLKGKRFPCVIGVNVCKNKDTPLQDAAHDYEICLEKLYPHIDFFTINVSSPNTPQLRELQNARYLQQLLARLKTSQEKLRAKHNKHVALVIKVAPDLADDEIEAMAKTFLEINVDGIIATNTTLSRHGVENNPHRHEVGGLSGQPLTSRSDEVIAKFAAILGGNIPIIGVGGIMSGEDAQRKIQLGAELIQVYTGLIYRGPDLLHEIDAALRTTSTDSKD